MGETKTISRGIRLDTKLWRELEEYRREQKLPTINDALEDLLLKWLKRRE